LRLFLLIATVSLTLAAPDPAAVIVTQTCPISTIQFQPISFDPLLGARYFSGAQADTSGWDSDGSGRARYDLLAGTVHVEGSEGPFASWQSHVWARDAYRLVGPAGPAVAVVARLRLTGNGDARHDVDPFGGTTTSGAVALWGVLRAAEGPVDSARFDAFPGQPAAVDHDLEVTLQHAAGEWFELTLSTNVGMFFGSGDLDGQLSFELPPGYAVESCQGYAGEGSVPARGTTWGALKTRYR
jgi:hypothetical protein